MSAVGKVLVLESSRMGAADLHLSAFLPHLVMYVHGTQVMTYVRMPELV